MEADMVVKYIDVLLSTNYCKHKISDSDIGIVTPYKMQANKILEKCELAFPGKNFTIGTAAILQGQEKPVMIISTVSVGHITDFAANFRVIYYLLIMKTISIGYFQCCLFTK